MKYSFGFVYPFGELRRKIYVYVDVWLLILRPLSANNYTVNFLGQGQPRSLRLLEQRDPVADFYVQP